VALIDDVKGIIQDDSKRLSDAEIISNINVAISAFAKDVGVFKIEELTAYNESLSLWNLPTDWIEGISFVKQLFDNDGNRLEWDFSYYGGTKYILTSDIYNSGKIYIEYAYLPTETDLTASQKGIILHYACYLCLMALAAYYAQTIDPVLSPDVVSYGSRSDTYIKLATEHLNIYKDKVRQIRYIKL